MLVGFGVAVGLGVLVGFGVAVGSGVGVAVGATVGTGVSVGTGAVSGFCPQAVKSATAKAQSNNAVFFMVNPLTIILCSHLLPYNHSIKDSGKKEESMPKYCYI